MKPRLPVKVLLVSRTEIDPLKSVVTDEFGLQLLYCNQRNYPHPSHMDNPPETFRVLLFEEKKIRQHGKYRTSRLVLEAWGRIEANGDFNAMGI